MFGIKFTPTDKKEFVRHLKKSTRFIGSTGSGASEWHFRDMSAVNSLHLHGNGVWEAHIDSFHPYANIMLHALIDYLPGTLQNLFQ